MARGLMARDLMARSLAVRLMAAALLVAAELAAVSAALVVAPVPAEAQFLFGDRFPFFGGFGRSNNRRGGGGWFGRRWPLRPESAFSIWVAARGSFVRS